MSIHRLARRIDAASPRLVDRGDRLRRFEPSDRDGILGEVARLRELLDLIHAFEEKNRARQDEHREEHATLAIERQRHRELLDLVPVATVLTTPSGMIEEANHAASDLFGIPACHLIDRPLASCASGPRAARRIFSHLSKLRRGAAGPLVFEAQLRASEGETVDARLRVSAVRGTGNAVAGLQWVIQACDAPEAVPRKSGPQPAVEAARVGVPESRYAEVRQRRLASAEDAEAYYRPLFDGALDAIVLFDSDRRLFDGNRAAHDLLGREGAKLEQLRLDDVIACDVEKLNTLMARLQSDGHWRGELELQQKDGAAVPLDASIAGVIVRGGIAFRMALREIADRDGGPEERSRAQREVVAMIGHELMNPLNGIRLHAELMKMQGQYRESSVDAILMSARDEQRLIDDLLDLARTDTMHLRLQPSYGDLLPILRCSIAESRAGTNAPVLRLDAPDELPYGYWDQGRIQQVFHNLLANAIKYSPRDSEICVRVDDLSDGVQVSVVDHGIGIDAEALPHVFDRFFRVDPGRAGPRGLGLGLYIVKTLVEAHGGMITAESQIGRGSIFRVSLPYAPPLQMNGASANLTWG